MEQEKLENKRSEQLFKLAKKWSKTNLVKDFVNELERKLREANAFTDENKKWIYWALNKAEKIDPLHNINELILINASMFRPSSE